VIFLYINRRSISRNVSTLTIKEECDAVKDALPHDYESVKIPAEYEEIKQANYAKIKFLEECDQETSTLNTTDVNQEIETSN
jgi:NifB/MoaA-like Fe-S oxidoreductase